MCSEQPAWERLISHALSTRERIPLVTAIFSDRNEVGMVGNLCGDNAQTFINVIDEVRIRTLSLPWDGFINSHSNFCALLVRYWITSNRISAGGACVLYTGFVVAKL